MIKSRLMDRYKGNLNEDYKAIREKQALIDGAGYGLWEIQGDDSVDFLDSIVTRDVKYLYLDKCFEALMLDDEANLVGAVTVINQNGRYLVMAVPDDADAVIDRMNQKIGSYSVQIVDMTEDNYLFIIEGQRVWKSVADILDYPIENVALRDCTEIGYEGTQLIMIRIGKTGEYAYTFIGEEEKAVSLAHKFLEAYDDMSVVADEAVKICMMETNYPIILKDQNIGVLEMAYQWHIQFEKTEYSGYQKLMELFESKPERLAVGICYDDQQKLDGSELMIDGQKVGSVIMSGYDPGLDKMIGYALVDSDMAVSGISLMAGDIEIQTISVPFLRPESWNLPMEE